MNLVFLLEEKSMKYLLDILLPKILPEGINPVTIAHNGKNDLKKSIPRKLAAWKTPNTRFVIVHDQDSHDCKVLKKELQEICNQFDRDVLIRIACHELEAWYFGDLKAVSQAYGKDYTVLSNKQKYRNPDLIENPKNEFRKLIPTHEQLSGAKRIGPFMDINNNTSKSFNIFVEGVRRLIS